MGSGGGPSGPSFLPDLQLQCDIPVGSVFVGNAGKNRIPSLVNPLLVTADAPGAGYLTEYAIGLARRSACTFIFHEWI
jgi:hypothetical protein